jgi:DNA-binding NarL/FixJ family response regulator
MTTDPRDLMQERALAAAKAQGAAKSVRPPAPRQNVAAGAAIAGEGVSDTAELMRLVSLIKQAEADNQNLHKIIVIGEFSVEGTRVPLALIETCQALTKAEAAVTRAVGWGRSNADIALLLNSNENTVRSHMNNVIRKMELDGMREYVTLAGLLFHPLD